MNFTADYANDLLRKLETSYSSEGKSADYIYSDPQFIEECKQQYDFKRLEITRLNQNISRYQVQYKNRVDEVENMRRSRGSMDEKVYRRLMDNAVGRRRKTLQRHARTKASLVTTWASIKELEVLRYAQISKLRRFWDHPSYKIENLSQKDFHNITDIVRLFFEPESSKLAA